MLDGRLVDRISAYLFHAGGDDDPATLAQNSERSFIGTYVLGMGFTFDDNNPRGVTSPIAEMHRLIEKDPRNAAVIHPFMSGEEFNDSPKQEPQRYVINFGDMTLDQARSWPNLLAIVEERVKPERDRNKRENYKALWWQFGERRPGLFKALANIPTYLALAAPSQHIAFARLPSKLWFSHPATVVASDRSADF